MNETASNRIQTDAPNGEKDTDAPNVPDDTGGGSASGWRYRCPEGHTTLSTRDSGRGSAPYYCNTCTEAYHLRVDRQTNAVECPDPNYVIDCPECEGGRGLRTLDGVAKQSERTHAYRAADVACKRCGAFLTYDQLRARERRGGLSAIGRAALQADPDGIGGEQV